MTGQNKKKYPFIVAEISANHNGKLDRALQIVDAAHRAGAQAIKLQTYTPDTMVADRDYTVRDGPWTGRNLYDLYHQGQTPWQWHAPIFAHAKHLGMTAFSTPFDASAVEFLESIKCPIYKIASFELTDLQLLSLVKKTNKPILLSTGMASKSEIQAALDVLQPQTYESGVWLLKCTSAYPATPRDANLATLRDYRAAFPGVRLGLSDHTPGSAVPVVATLLGATVIEKHLTLDGEDGPDSKFSLKPSEFANMVREVQRAVDAIGEVKYGYSEAELPSVSLRRSCYVVQTIEAGDILNRQNLKLRRPGHGIEPRHIESLYGRKVNQSLSAGTPLTWDVIE